MRRTVVGDEAEAGFRGTSRFEVRRRIGAGGMGVVYEAFDREQRAPVALKVLRTLEPEALLRFKNEFRVLQDIRHPNLVSLGELFEEKGQWFFTMEMVQGLHFIEHIETGPVAPSGRFVRMGIEIDEHKVRSSIAQLARGLHALHRARKVHRDIKPSNILVTEAGRVVILDFGLVVDLSAALPESYLVGTAWYMAPEQARLKPIGPAADWYSVGVLLYQALTGRLPVEGNAREVLFMKQTIVPQPPRSLADVPEDLSQLCVDLLKIDPRERPTGREVLRRLGAEQPTTLSEYEPEVPHFVGRSAELNDLSRAYVAATGGGWKERSSRVPPGPLPHPPPPSSTVPDSRESRGVTVIVHGESGVGKSAITRRFLELLREDDPGVLILSGRCYEREAVPYKAVDGIIDALVRALAPLGEDEVTEVLPVDLRLVAQVFPVVRRIEIVAHSQSRIAAALDPQALRARLFQALREMFTRLAAHRALVLTIDDLQWADADSLALLSEIMRPPYGPRLLLIATMRGALVTDLGAKDAEWPTRAGPLTVQQVKKLFSGDVREIRVEALPKADARALALALLRGAGAGQDLSADVVAEEAGGHPLFIDELVRRKRIAGSDAGVIRLEDALSARVAELDPGARRLLDLIAVARAPVAQEVAASAAQIEQSLFAERASLLRAANLARTSGTRRDDLIEPYHDRVREAVLLGLQPGAERALHERLAIALEAYGKADPEALAIHWREAGDPSKAADHAARAAADAERALAFDRAARLYKLAIELRPETTAAGGALRVKLGDALVNAGRGTEAAAAYLSAGPLVGPEEAVDLKRRAAEQLLRSGHIDEAMEAFRDVLAAIDMKLPRTPRRALASLLFRRAQIRVRGLGFRERSESDVPPPDLKRIDTCWSVGAGLGLVNTITGSYFQSRGLLLALDAGEPHRVARAFAMEASYSSASGGPSARRTAELVEATAALARRLDHPYALAWASGAAGISACLEGRWTAGHACCQEAEAAFSERCTGVHWEIGTMRWFSLWSQSYLGQLASLSKRAPERLREARDRGDLYAAIGHSTGLANLVWLAADDPDLALERSRDVMQQWSQQTFHVEHWWAMLGERQVDLYKGDAEVAYRRVMEQWPALSGSLLLMVQLTKLEALHLRARCALMFAKAGGGDAPALCRAALRDAADIEKEHMPWSSPLALLLRAGAAWTRGDKDRALSLLREAEPGLAAADMGLYAAAARYRIGKALGGDEGSALVSGAEGWMKGQGIKNAPRMVAMHAPGFDD